MNITTSLLYLLLLYAVLDKDNKLSLTTGLVLAFAVLLFNCCNRGCLGGASGTQSGENVFSKMNNFC